MTYDKVQYRMDPRKVQYWMVRQQGPPPFWLDPTTQTITARPPDGRVWLCVPVHDPAWGPS